MRVVTDVPFDKDVHRTSSCWWSGKDAPIFDPEDFQQGRVTVSLEDGLIKDALLEHEYLKLGPSKWPTAPMKGVISLSDPMYVGNIPVRKDIECTPAEVASPAKGWFIGEVEAISITNSIAPQAPTSLPPPKPYVKPLFESVVWQ